MYNIYKITVNLIPVRNKNLILFWVHKLLFQISLFLSFSSQDEKLIAFTRGFTFLISSQGEVFYQASYVCEILSLSNWEEWTHLKARFSLAWNL